MTEESFLRVQELQFFQKPGQPDISCLCEGGFYIWAGYCCINKDNIDLPYYAADKRDRAAIARLFSALKCVGTLSSTFHGFPSLVYWRDGSEAPEPKGLPDKPKIEWHNFCVFAVSRYDWPTLAERRRSAMQGFPMRPRDALHAAFYLLDVSKECARCRIVSG